jgi:hypothetical protein
MKKTLFFFPVMLLILQFIIVDKSVAQQNFNDSLFYNTSDIDIGQQFRTGYFTSFGHWTINSFIEDIEGNLHIAYVDNYELFYFRSTDDGETWSKEQIITGNEGDIRFAALAVDLNGKVFIGFTIHPLYNYANPTGITGANEFYYDLYCANNKSGSWNIEQVALHSSGNFGPVVESISVDSNNDVHLYANRYGWNSLGGEAWEWVRYSSSDAWSSQIIITQFNDAGIDKFIYDNYIVLVDSFGRRALIAARTKSDGPKLFYVLNDGSGWETPVELSDNIAVAWNRFDAVISPLDTVYIAYFYNDAQGLPELKVSIDTQPPITASINLPSTDTLNYLKIHCNAEGKFTMYLWIKNKNVHVTFSDDFVNWSDPIEIPDSLKNYFGGLIVKTDTRQGYYTDYCKQINVIAGPRTAQPYGPDTLLYGDINMEPLTSIKTIPDAPSKYILNQNFPNPFNPSTLISFSLPERSFVELKIYNILGVEVANLISKELPAGNYSQKFDASNLSSGVYLYKLNAAKFTAIRKMILIK